MRQTTTAPPLSAGLMTMSSRVLRFWWAVDSSLERFENLRLLTDRERQRDKETKTEGEFLWENPNPVLNPKTDFSFLWQNPKRDYESNESVPDKDSMD